jgi:hypothetical protein
MGLDMMIYRRNKDATERGDFQGEEIAYWRKHPNLHGFIVKEFAAGRDDCQQIPLDSKKMLTLIRAIMERKLPETTGFFFGSSPSTDNELTFVLQQLEDMNQLAKAIEALQDGYEIFYQASW